MNEKEARTYMLRAFGISFCGQAEKRPGIGVSGLSFSFSVFDVFYPSIATVVFFFFFQVFIGKFRHLTMGCKCKISCLGEKGNVGNR